MGVSIIQAVPLPTPASSPPMLCGGKRHSFRTVYSVAGNTIPSWARERAPRGDGGDGRSDLGYCDTLVNLVNDVHPGKDREAVRNWAGQIANFVLEIDSEDFVLTPSADSQVLRFGRIPPT